QESYRQPRASLERELCQRFSEHTRELETVPREARHKQHVLLPRMSINHKMLIRRHRVKANAPPLHGPANAWKKLRQERLDPRQIVRVERPRIIRRIIHDRPTAVLGHLHAQLVDLRKAVINALRQLK